MSGYLSNPAANADAFVDGWFRTGDRGVVRDGYLYLEGRLKEMILRGGENISPAEIEQALLAHPAVADAVCFGISDDKYGEVSAAAVTLSQDVAGQRADRALPRAAGGVQGADRHLRAGRDPAHGHGQGAAPPGRRAHRGHAGGRMRFAVLGAGAIGAYAGACLARGGADVTLIARGAHLAAMQRDGVRVQSRRGDFTARPRATDDWAALAERGRGAGGAQGLQPARGRAPPGRAARAPARR